MGQDHSSAAAEANPEQLSQELALKFANQCYTPLEVFCFKEVFRELADVESGLKHWSESTLCRHLQIPDVLHAGPVLFQMVTFLGSFPQWELAPCILTVSNLLKAITLVTRRYKKILKDQEQDRILLFYASVAVIDRRASEIFTRDDLGLEVTDEEALEETLKGVSGFSITGEAEEEEPVVTNEAGLLERSTLALMHIPLANFQFLSDRPEIKLSIIPSDNLLHMIQLVLFVTPMEDQTDLREFSTHLTDDYLTAIRRCANTILASFGVEQRHGVTYNAFRSVIPSSLPYMFDSLSPLFEHFLYDTGFDLGAKKGIIPPSTEVFDELQSPRLPQTPQSPQIRQSPTEIAGKEEKHGLPFTSPISEPGDILDLATLTQLSFFIPSTTMFHRLHHLFSGNKHGFSLGSLETQVFTWRAPTILLVKGTLLTDNPTNSRERSFADSLPPKRFPSSTVASTNSSSKENSRAVVYGAYISTPWKHTHKSYFGDVETMLFQLSPVHDVFRASAVSKEYASYLTPSPQIPHAGINLGSALPATASSKASGSSSTHTSDPHVTLGPISLYLDDSLEYGVFTHSSSGGGSFHPSNSPSRMQHSPHSPRSPSHSQTFESNMYTSPTSISPSSRRRTSRAGSIASPLTSPASPPLSSTTRTGTFPGASSGAKASSLGDWQDRFEIESLEVWGCGGDEEAGRQRRRIEAEEREAKMRREGVVGRGDVDADRELLMLAGLIGRGREGGSV